MKIAYLRVSSSQQSIERQKKDVLDAHPDIEKFFEETGSGLKERPVLEELLPLLRFGDILVVESFSRLSRNTKELLEHLEYFEKKDIRFVSVKEEFLTGRGESTKTTAATKLMVTVMSALSQFEVDNLKERQNTGLEILRRRGDVTRKKRITLDDPKVKHAIKLYNEDKHTVTEICKITGLTRPTFYQKLKESGIELKTK